jgi:hypothetical protein
MKTSLSCSPKVLNLQKERMQRPLPPRDAPPSGQLTTYTPVSPYMLTPCRILALPGKNERVKE